MYLTGFADEAGKILDFDLTRSKGRRRLRGPERVKRDILIYCLWHSGKLSNQRIGGIFSISYSGVSHAVKRVKSKMKSDNKIRSQIEAVNSQFKL